MKITTVDEFLKHKVLEEHLPIVSSLRKLMREYAPGAKEVITYGILAWKVDKFIAVISPTKKDITFAFSKGAEFEDKYSMLGGTGKVSKFIKMKDVKAIKKTALRYYIKQALDLEKK